jgi:hypothetical protein
MNALQREPENDVTLLGASKEHTELGQPTSPRAAFVKRKFPSFCKDESVLDNFSCAYAAKGKILLQGMLYLTAYGCYFYSPFNSGTLVG